MSNHFRFSKAIASVGVGFSPILPGTLGSLVGLFLYLFAFRSFFLYGVATFFLFGLGLLASHAALKTTTEKDPSWIVIDETLGMMISFFQIPPRIPLLVIGFALFRFFDSVKPFPLERLETLKGEWGILMDDVGAGIYTSIILHLVLTFSH